MLHGLLFADGRGMTDLTIDVEQAADHAVLRLIGELDMDSRAELLIELSNTMTGCRLIELDASGLRFIDSSGIAALMDAQQRAAAAGATMRLIHATHNVQRVLSTVGLSEMLTGEQPGATPG